MNPRGFVVVERPTPCNVGSYSRVYCSIEKSPEPEEHQELEANDLASPPVETTVLDSSMKDQLRPAIQRVSLQHVSRVVESLPSLSLRIIGRAVTCTTSRFYAELPSLPTDGYRPFKELGQQDMVLPSTAATSDFYGTLPPLLSKASPVKHKADSSETKNASKPLTNTSTGWHKQPRWLIFWYSTVINNEPCDNYYASIPSPTHGSP